MSKLNYSDEVISAFVDGQLTRDERIEILAAATESDLLRRRICEIQQLKELVSSAYPEVDETKGRPKTMISGFARYGAVAALGAVSLYAVLATNGQLTTPRELTAERMEAKAVIDESAVSQVVFHVSSGSPAEAAELLDQVELVLTSYADKRQPIRVEVVANNQGIRMLQQGRSGVAQRVAQMHQTYPNLVFAACGNTIERLRKSHGEQIKILPEAVIIRSGVSFVARRQQSGWSYIKV